jgi:hypothetical protein
MLCMLSIKVRKDPKGTNVFKSSPPVQSYAQVLILLTKLREFIENCQSLSDSADPTVPSNILLSIFQSNKLSKK